MNSELRSLIERINRELLNIEATVQLAIEAQTGTSQFPDQYRHFLNSLALHLHSFYNGVERVFESIARQIDPTFPSGTHWHRDLLE